MVICGGGSITSQCDHITEELIHCYIVDLSGSHSVARLTYSTEIQPGIDWKYNVLCVLLSVIIYLTKSHLAVS